MVQRKYKAKDVDMVIAISTIISNAKGNQEFLQTKRSTFTLDYFTQLEAEIDLVTQKYLGADNARDLRLASISLYATQEEALRLAGEIKLQILLDFGDNAGELLNNLGFITYWARARKKDQEALIDLLFRFKTNMTPALREEMIAHGTMAADIDSLIAKADLLKTSDASQELHKTNRPLATEEAIAAFNGIYSKVMSVAKMATVFYKGNSTHQNLFSFSKISKNISMPKKAAAASGGEKTISESGKLVSDDGK